MRLTAALTGGRISAVGAVAVVALATSTTAAPIVSIVVGERSIARAMRRGSSAVSNVPFGTLAFGRHRSLEVALLFIVSLKVEDGKIGAELSRR